MVKSAVLSVPAYALVALSLLTFTGCSSGDGDGFSPKNVSIDLVNPPCAEPGSISGYIEGNGFGAENVTITVGGIEAEVITATGHDASFVVPEGIPSGPIQVVVMNPGGRIATINWVSCVNDTEVARIEITPAAVVLTEQDGTYQLTAQAYNAGDQALDADFTWTSLDPADVEVGPMGLVTAMVPIGSAQITAEAHGVTSGPAVVTVARPVAGAVFVSDDQVVEGPSFAGEPADLGVGSLIQLVLEGIAAPSVGDILLPLETLSVGGRVADAQETSPGVFLVSLEIIPLSEMYEEYAIDETFELSVADAIPGELVQDFYEAELQPDGSYLFTLKPEAIAQKAGAVGTRAFFDCTLLDYGEPDSVVGLPLQIDALPTSITIQPNISLVVKWDGDPATDDRIALKAEIEASLSSTLTITAVLEAKFECLAELLRFPIPAFTVGPFYGGGIVPLGLGWKVGGKLTVANVGVKVGVKPKASIEVGIRCPAGQGCDIYETDMFDAKTEVEWIFPDLNNLGAQLRLEPSISGFAYAEIEIGVDLILKRISARAIKFQAGVVQDASLALVEGQIFNPLYKSDYKLSFELTAGLGPDAKALLGFLQIQLPKVEVKKSWELLHSPTLAEATVDVATYEQDDEVTFEVKLNPKDVNYIPFVYNVDEVLIYEALLLPGGTKDAREIASVTPSFDGQTDFVIPWTPITDGTIEDNFFAAVETSLLPKLPDPVTFGILELGRVRAPKAAGRIVFQSNRDGNLDIFMMNADGSDQTNLSEDPASDTTPTWFPDGTTIGFTSDRDGERDIWTMDAMQGALQTNLTDTNLSEESWPSWSPNGTSIAFDLQNNLGREIYVMDDDGSNRTNLSNASGTDTTSTWSPDGTKIAFAATRDGDFEIYVMNANGSGQTNLTNNAALDSAPSWSPNGTKIAFWSDRDGNREVYVMNADGSGVQRLTNNPARDTNPTWSPDGTEIAFRSDRDGNSEIYVMYDDGSGQTNLTGNPASDTNPRWSPLP